MHIEAVLPAMASGNRGVSRDAYDELQSSALAAMRVLRDLIPWSGYALCAWDATFGSHRHVTLASEGYSTGLLDHMNDGFIESNPAFEILHTKVPRALMWYELFRDWDLDFAGTQSAQEFLIPEGFHEGQTMCLRLPDGRYTGCLHVSWATPHEITEEARILIQHFRPLLAVVCDLLRSAQIGLDRLGPEAHAVLISREGRVSDMPGRSAGSILCEGTPLRQALSWRAKHLGHRRYLWADSGGACHRIETVPCHGSVTLVTEQTVPWPFQLTPREAQILHFIAGGRSNPQIAGKLAISPRTVSTHVEHILNKLGCLTRAELAAVAVSENLLLASEVLGSASTIDRPSITR